MQDGLENTLRELEKAQLSDPDGAIAKQRSGELAWLLHANPWQKNLRTTLELETISAVLRFLIPYHAGVKRASGESYLTHPVAVAMKGNSHLVTLIAGLVHDTVEAKVDPIAEEFIRDKHLSYKVISSARKNRLGKRIIDTLDIWPKSAKLKALARINREQIEAFFKAELGYQASYFRNLAENIIKRNNAPAEERCRLYADIEDIISVHNLMTRRTYLDYQDESHRMIRTGDLKTAMNALIVRLNDRTHNCMTMGAELPVGKIKKALQRMAPLAPTENLQKYHQLELDAYRHNQGLSAALNRIKLIGASMNNKLYHFLFDSVRYSYSERAFAAAKTQLVITRALELLQSTEKIKDTYLRYCNLSGTQPKTMEHIISALMQSDMYAARKDFENVAKNIKSHNYYHRKNKQRFIYFEDTDEVLNVIIGYCKPNESTNLQKFYLGLLLKYYLDKIGYSYKTEIMSIKEPSYLNNYAQLISSMKCAMFAARELLRQGIIHYELFHVSPIFAEKRKRELLEYEKNTGGFEGITDKIWGSRWLDNQVKGFIGIRMRGERPKKPKSLREPFLRHRWYEQMLTYNRIFERYQEYLSLGIIKPLKGRESRDFDYWDYAKLMKFHLQ